MRISPKLLVLIGHLTAGLAPAACAWLAALVLGRFAGWDVSANTTGIVVGVVSLTLSLGFRWWRSGDFLGVPPGHSGVPTVMSAAATLATSAVDAAAIILLLISVLRAAGGELETLEMCGGPRPVVAVLLAWAFRTTWGFGVVARSGWEKLCQPPYWRTPSKATVETVVLQSLLGATAPFAGLYMLQQPRAEGWGFLLPLCGAVVLAVLAGIATKNLDQEPTATVVASQAEETSPSSEGR